METRQQRLIREALEHGSAKSSESPSPTVSLRDKSLQHTGAGYVPRTLTAHEWEAYYSEHGVPATHRKEPPKQAPARSLKAILVRFFGR